jgi:aromatic ring-opening dioxygenase catalytic subunit (LigB family)
MASQRFPVLFISHGGGPWPWMLERMAGRYDKLAAALRRIPAEVGDTPAAILMVSAHWEEPVFTAMTHPHPPMLYDYHGFPEDTYRVRYPAPGAPALAAQACERLEAAGIATGRDAERGFDHGVFSPMQVMYPEAQVPVAQLSLRQGLDPREHLAAGRALAPLRDAGVLIVGSGLSYHNLRAFGPAARAASAPFDDWLQRTLAIADPAAREAALAAWESAPAARAAHPREEHLLPLMVAVGAAGGDRAACVYHEDDFLGGVSVSNFMFGDAVAPARETPAPRR